MVEKTEGYVTKAEVEKLLKEQEIKFLKMMLVREQINSSKKYK